MSVNDTSLVKSARRGIAAVLVVLVAAVAFHFATRRQRSERPASEKPVPEAQKVDRKEGLKHREYKDGKVWADVRADRFFLGEDGLDHLEGAVEIVDYGREDGRETRISADKVAYDRDMIHFMISGRVRVSSRDLVFESGFLEYDKNLGQYWTRRGGTFSSEKLAGSGRTLEYDENKNEIRLSGGFSLEIKAAPESSGTACLSGDSLIYQRIGKSGTVEGRVRVAAWEGEGTSDLLRFELTEDERTLRSAAFEKGARCVFGSGQDRSGKRVVEAETVRVFSWPGSTRVSAVEAKGNCRLTLSGPPEPGGQAQAGEARLAFDRDGKLESWTASGDARMNLDEGPGAAQNFAGKSISYSSRSGVLTVLAEEGGAARLESAESRIEASSISLAAGPKTADASGAIRFLLKPRPDGAPIGFFSRNASLFITCRAMRSFGGDRRFHFEGNVRAWQDDGSIQAEEFDVLMDSGEVRGGGGVTADFSQPPKGASGERRVEVGGDGMAFSPADRTVLFHGRGFVKMPDARLTAGTVAVSLFEERKELKSLRASGGVVVFQGNCEGRGGEARYDPDADTLVLTGGPSLVEKGKGASRGDKLTFRLGDGRILIENKGQGRSITIVNREK
jgi:lipopolysaccharide export system protein LptA